MNSPRIVGRAPGYWSHSSVICKTNQYVYNIFLITWIQIRNVFGTQYVITEREWMFFNPFQLSIPAHEIRNQASCVHRDIRRPCSKTVFRLTLLQSDVYLIVSQEHPDVVRNTPFLHFSCNVSNVFKCFLAWTAIPLVACWICNRNKRHMYGCVQSRREHEHFVSWLWSTLVVVTYFRTKAACD